MVARESCLESRCLAFIDRARRKFVLNRKTIISVENAHFFFPPHANESKTNDSHQAKKVGFTLNSMCERVCRVRREKVVAQSKQPPNPMISLTCIR